MSARWRAVEEIPGLAAVLPVWRRRVGEEFESFRTLCLQVGPKPATLYPCPYATGCAYEICRQPDNSILGLCRTASPFCPNTIFTEEDVLPLHLNWQKLARELCKALSLNSKFQILPMADTVQVGSWSADAVPVILTIQRDRTIFTHIITGLIARLNRPFILLAPTSFNVTAPCDELLAHARAGFFAIENIVTLTGFGTLQPKIAPGELFQKFTPQPKEADQNAAERAFILMRQFDSTKLIPSPLTIFRLYCMECLSANEVAKRVKCSKATVISRLKFIQQKTGASPATLRQISSHLDTPLAADSRARHIHRKNLIDQPDDECGM
jgi:hypothetical protein